MSTESVNVLFFSSQLGTGGAERHVVRIANHLDRNRFRVAVAVARGGGVYEPELAGDVDLHVLNAPRMIRACKPLRTLVTRLRPDVVCGVMDHANVVSILACSGLPDRPAVVGTVRDPIRRRHQAGVPRGWEHPSLRV
jgi:hypothetical protein